MISQVDKTHIEAQLGREIRGALEVAHYCVCGKPDVVKTAPRLPDGTPFPTMFYATCPKLTSAIGTLEANNVMKEMQERLGTDAELAENYRQAHNSYLAEREEIEHVLEIAGITAGGMPDRVKCLHVLAGHALAKGPGVNLLGDEVLALVAGCQDKESCVN
jgi:hypothetical protein